MWPAQLMCCERALMQRDEARELLSCGVSFRKKYKPRPAVWVTCDSWSLKYKGRWLERKMIDVQMWRVERSCRGRIKLEGTRASLQGGFPEVTVVNIPQECGMLNRCQSKHTGRATATPNDCQELLYKHMLSCMCTSTEPTKHTLKINTISVNTCGSHS